MSDVNNDEELLSLVRVTIGASKATDVSTRNLRKALSESKADVSAEVQEQLQRGATLDFYNQDAPHKALESLMFLRGKALKGNSPDAPRGISAIRRHNYDDTDASFWQSELIRNLNRVSEN